MTDITEAKIAELKEAAGDEYLLISHGLYWRPESAGYTGDKTKAGLYSKERADDHVKHGGLAIAYKNAQRFSPKCDPHVRWEIIEMENTALLAENAKLREALDPFSFAAKWAEKDDDEKHLAYGIKASDLRRARAAIGDNTDV